MNSRISKYWSRLALLALGTLLPVGAYAQSDDRICPGPDGNLPSVTVCPTPAPTAYPSYPTFPGYAGGGGQSGSGGGQNPGSTVPPPGMGDGGPASGPPSTWDEHHPDLRGDDELGMCTFICYTYPYSWTNWVMIHCTGASPHSTDCKAAVDRCTNFMPGGRGIPSAFSCF